MKILLLDTNVSSYPIYNSLLKFKFNVFVCGNNQNDCLAKISNNYIKLDYSDIAKVLNICKKLEVDFVIPGCNDVSYKTATLCNHKLTKKLNISSPRINDIINNKVLFKKFAIENNITVPRSFNSNLSFSSVEKIIVKPSDSYSGNGITVLEKSNFKNLDVAINLAKSFSKDNNISIEEFIDGDLYSHSAFIENGIIKNDFIVKEYCFKNEYAVDTSWVISNDEFQNLELIRIEINKLIKALNLNDGLVHTQFISGEEKVNIIEVTRRCPGDLYSLLIKYSTGFDYSKNYTNYFFNKKSSEEIFPSKKIILRHTISGNRTFNFISLKLQNQIDYKVIDFIPSVYTGSQIKPTPIGKVGIIFFELKSKKELIDLKNIIKKGQLLHNDIYE